MRSAEKPRSRFGMTLSTKAVFLGLILVTAQTQGQEQASASESAAFTLQDPTLPLKLSATPSSSTPSGAWTLELEGTIAAPLKFNAAAPWAADLRDQKQALPTETSFQVTKQVFRATLTTAPELPLTQKDETKTATGSRPSRYKVTAFVCDAAETWCKRQTIEGTIDWSRTKVGFKQGTIAKRSPAADTSNQTALASASKVNQSSNAASSATSDTSIGPWTWQTVGPFTGDGAAWQTLTAKWSRPALVFWTAAWCPPCNELKDRIFRHPDFGALTRGVERILIDGDAPNAQRLGETLRVSGYPTVLIVLPGGTEAARINESLSFEEFAATFRAATANPAPLKDRISRALEQKATDEDWLVIAQTRWEAGSSAPGNTACETVKALGELARRAPEQQSARALLTFAALSWAGDCKEPIPEKNALARELATLLVGQTKGQHILATERLVSLRAPLVQTFEAAQSVIDSLPKAEATATREAWLAAVQDLTRMQGRSEVSDLDRLRAMTTLVEAEKQQGQAVSPATRKAVVELSQSALKSNLSLYGRRALVTEVTYALGQVQAFDEAEQVLAAELKHSDPSWHHYLYSARAALETERGKLEQARGLSTQAQAAASGRATRLQWTVSDALRSLKDNSDLVQSLGKVDDVYRIAFSLEDPFYGRNAKRLQALQSKLVERSDLTALQSTFSRYAPQCVNLRDSTQVTRCREHFAPLLGKMSSK